jgi:hypothetical protein
MAIEAGDEADNRRCRVIVGRVGAGATSSYSFCGDPGTLREFEDGTSTTPIPICERHGEALDGGTVYAVVTVRPDLTAIELL